MTGLIFVGMLPPESHNPEERRFVEELAKYFQPVRYLRGIGVKGLRLEHLWTLPRRLHGPASDGDWALAGSLKIIPFRIGTTRLNAPWIQRQLLAASDGQPERWLLWTRFPSPELVKAIGEVGFRDIVYEPIDRYSAAGDFTPGEARRIEEAEKRLSRMATVIAGSRTLTTDFSDARGGSHWIPFGHDVHRPSGGAGVPENIGRPRVCVVAEFDWRIDHELLLDVARCERTWQLMLAGPRRSGVDRRLDGLSNVHWMGGIAPERVRPVIADCDVTLIPYRLNNWTRACLPVKLFEYLAEGKPVVATPLPELDPFADTIVIARRERFTVAIAEALAGDHPSQVNKRRRAALRFTLEDRARQAATLLRAERATLPR